MLMVLKVTALIVVTSRQIHQFSVMTHSKKPSLDIGPKTNLFLMPFNSWIARLYHQFLLPTQVVHLRLRMLGFSPNNSYFRAYLFQNHFLRTPYQNNLPSSLIALL